MQTRAAAFLAIANVIAGVSTFAGDFTFSTVVSLHFSNSCKDNSVIDILSDAFVLFTLSLFFVVTITILLQSFEPEASLDNKDGHYYAILGIFTINGGFLVGGYILLNVVLVKIGQKSAGIGGITGVVIAAAVLFILGFGYE